MDVALFENLSCFVSFLAPDISGDGEPLGAGETAGIVVLTIVVVGFVIGLR